MLECVIRTHQFKHLCDDQEQVRTPKDPPGRVSSYRTCPLEGPNPKNGKIIVVGRRKKYVKKITYLL